MPLYDMKCVNCGLEIEFFSPILDIDKKKCPRCNGKMTILITISSKPVVLNEFNRGLGIYTTGPMQRDEVAREKGLEPL